MTKELAPIKLLARKYITKSGYAIIANSELEQLRQAIIKDFVSKLEPVGYLKVTENGSTYFNASFSGGCNFIPVYELQEWRSK